MKTNKALKLTTAICETILGIPIAGGILVISLLWIPLIVMLVLHIVTLVFSKKEDSDYRGSILGIIASVLGWIPILGMVLHMVTAVMLWLSFIKKDTPISQD